MSSDWLASAAFSYRLPVTGHRSLFSKRGFQGVESAPKAVNRVDQAVFVHPHVVDLCRPLRGELGRAGHKIADFLRLERVLGALPLLPEPSGIWRRVAEARFTLARGGVQAAVTDLLIAIVALDAGHTLLTRDRDFERIRSAVPVDLECF